MESNAPQLLATKEPSAEFRRIAGLSTALLEAMLVGGDTPSLEGMTGYEYCGYNIAPTTALLGIRKFVKAFFEMADGSVYGCNTPAVQNGLQGQWIARPSEAVPRRYAFFSVTPVDPEARRELARERSAGGRADGERCESGNAEQRRTGRLRPDPDGECRGRCREETAHGDHQRGSGERRSGHDVSRSCRIRCCSMRRRATIARPASNNATTCSSAMR